MHIYRITIYIKPRLKTLGKRVRVDEENLRAELKKAYFHHWQSDPLGAYTYGKVGADGAGGNSPLLCETDTTGNNGTVHGAIASGYRAAAEVWI